MEGETVLTHGGAVSGFLSVNALVPRTRSAVVLLTNTEHLPADSLHSTILRLLLEDQKKQRDRPTCPRSAGLRPRTPPSTSCTRCKPARSTATSSARSSAIFLTDLRLAGGGNAAQAPGRAGKGRRRRRVRARGHGGRHDPVQVQDGRPGRVALPDARRQNPAVLDPQAVSKHGQVEIGYII